MVADMEYFKMPDFFIFQYNSLNLYSLKLPLGSFSTPWEKKRRRRRTQYIISWTPEGENPRLKSECCIVLSPTGF